jgi:hypothetical protein
MTFKENPKRLQLLIQTEAIIGTVDIQKAKVNNFGKINYTKLTSELLL